MEEDLKQIVKAVFLIIMLFVAPLIAMLVWNNILVQVCHFEVISYWQMFFVGVGLRIINGTLSTRMQNN